MRTISTTIYNIEDVKADKNLLAKVLEENRYHNYQDEDSHWIIENFEESCESFGLNITRTLYSGFGSQGDGASFVGTYQAIECTKEESEDDKLMVDCKNRLEKLRILSGGFLRIEIFRSGHYYHENSMDFVVTVDEDCEEHEDFIKQEASDIFKTLAKELYNKLEDNYYNTISDESLLEYFTDYEYEFLEDGSIFNE